MKIELSEKPSLKIILETLKANAKSDQELVLIDQLGEVFDDPEEIESALSSMKLDKVDAHWMRHEALETHLAALKARAKKVAKLIEAHENYLLHVMQSSDEKKLEGDLHWIRRNVKSKTEIIDANRVPSSYIKTRHTFVFSLDMDGQTEIFQKAFDLIKTVDSEMQFSAEDIVDKRAVKEVIKSGQEVPGARLVDSISWSQNPRKQIE